MYKNGTSFLIICLCKIFLWYLSKNVTKTILKSCRIYAYGRIQNKKKPVRRREKEFMVEVWNEERLSVDPQAV